MPVHEAGPGHRPRPVALCDGAALDLLRRPGVVTRLKALADEGHSPQQLLLHCCFTVHR